jgi:hypothetical protein
VRDGLRVSQNLSHVYFHHTPCLTKFTFEFIRRPIPPILSPSYWTFVELTLVTNPPNVTFRRNLYGPRLVSWENLLQHLVSVQLTDGKDEFQ